MTPHEPGRLEPLDGPEPDESLDGLGPRDRRALVGGDGDCAHPSDERVYLGQMGTAALYRCAACGGAIIRW